MRTKNQQTRRHKGSALTEMGPALFILLMMIFFPMLDLMSMAFSYCSCFYLNVQQTKQAAMVKASDATSATGTVQKAVVDSWLNNGVGKFVKTTAYPATKIDYTAGQTDPNTKVTDQFVTVTTTISCNPFLTIPFWFPVPGLSAPMTFVISSQAQMENPDNRFDT